MLLGNHITIVLHLVHNWLLLLKVERLKVEQDPVPLCNTPIEVVSWWLARILEEQAPKLCIFASLLDCDHLLIGSFMLLEQLDVLSSLCDVWQKISWRDVSALPDIDWLV